MRQNEHRYPSNRDIQERTILKEKVYPGQDENEDEGEDGRECEM